MSLIERKQIKNNKYNIGKNNQLGYESGNMLNTNNTYSVGAYSGYQNAANQINRNILPQTLSSAGQYGSTITGMFTNYTSNAAARAANIASLGQKFAPTMATANVADKLSSFTNKQIETGTKLATGNAVKSGFNAAGTALGIAGSLYGAYNTYNAAQNFNNRISNSDMMNASGYTYNNIDGEQYKTYDGFDESGIIDYTKQQNKADTTNLALNAAGTGASVGGLVGNIIPGVGGIAGAAIGGIIGGLGGLLFGDSESEERMDQIKQGIANVNTAQQGYNTDSRSRAISRNMRRKFVADKGKNPTYNEGKVGDIRMVHTSQGIVPGIQFGLAGKGESIYNPNNGTASVYEEGQKRVDNIPTGVPLRKFNAGKEWGDTIIFGNRLNPFTGNTFADDAKPFSKILEQANKDNDMNINKHTRQLNIKNAQNKLNILANQQMLTANCGKNRFDGGKWGDYATMLLPHLGQMGMVLGSRQDYTPAYRESYVDDGTASDINQLYSLKYDPTQALSNINKASRAAKYNIINAGNLSSGQRAAINSANELAAASSKNDIIDQYNQKNIALKQAALQASIAAKQSNAQRLQNAREQAIARNDRAQAINDNFRQQYYANMAAQFGSIGKDLMAMNQYNNAINYQNRLLNLYDQEIKNRK